MKNTFGQSITVTLFGESHGPSIGVVIDGLTPGIPIDEETIAAYLAKRRPSSQLDTARREQDAFRVVSGVFAGKSTGTPLCILIPNEDVHSRDYTYGPARPSHADYAAYRKYHGYEDYRGGGHFSGRLTAALVAAGGVLLPMLESVGVHLGTHILRCAAVQDRPFADSALSSDFAALRESAFPVLDTQAAENMQQAITRAAQEKDSVGGVTQTAVVGLPAGLGEPWFDSMEGLLSHAIFSIGGIKGIEFGDGFALTGLRGSAANDPFRYASDGHVETVTNHNGGINGGLTNGMPILFQCAVKPTSSIGIKQDTIDFVRRTDTKLTVTGRHDPAIIKRICPVIDSVTAIVLCDVLAQRYGTDFFLKGEKRCSTV